MNSALAPEGCFPLQTATFSAACKVVPITAAITETFEEANLGIRLRGGLAGE